MGDYLMSGDFQMLEECRVCGSSDVVPVLDLGDQPLANSLKRSPDEPEALYPLAIGFCRECSLVQLLATVQKEVLFDQYVWVTGTSSTARAYARSFSERVVLAADLQSGDLVVEVASNDGTFLRPFTSRGMRTLGVDPARNIAEAANAAGIETIPAYWGTSVAAEVEDAYGPAKAVIARNVIPHVSELHDVVRGMHDVLAPEGVCVIEFHYGGTILRELHYDSIYHEHLCYFSLSALLRLMSDLGLRPFHVDTSPISGGSLVVYSTRAEDRREESATFRRVLSAERGTGVGELESWMSFAVAAEQHRDDSLCLFDVHAGETVVGFGASARSSTYLNYCGFTSEHIRAIIDNNPLKQGLYASGTSIPIVSLSDGLGMVPDVVFVMAWNFQDEIIAECRDAGHAQGFIVPFPGSPRFVAPAGG